MEIEFELSQVQKSLNFLRNCSELLLQDNDVLIRDVRQSVHCLRDLKEDEQLIRAVKQALECLYGIFQPFAYTYFEELTASDCYSFPRVARIAIPQGIYKQ